jgi:hypothetical protein
VRATVRFETFSSLCRVDIEVQATTGAVLGVDDCCLTGAC